MAHLQTWNTTDTLGKEVMNWIRWGSPHHEHGGCHWMSAILHMHKYSLSAKSSVLVFFKIKMIMSNTYLKHFNYHSSSRETSSKARLLAWLGEGPSLTLVWVLTYTISSEKLKKNACEIHFFPPVKKFCWTLSGSVRVTCLGWQDFITSSMTVKLGWKLITARGLWLLDSLEQEQAENPEYFQERIWSA